MENDISKKYSGFFTLVNRLNSDKKISILIGEKFEEFMKMWIAESTLDRQFRVLIVVMICGGLRISEALLLTKKDFFTEDGHLFAESDVLKKRRKDGRMILIHPIAQQFVLDYINSKVGPLFDYTRDGIFKKLKRTFNIIGICNHSWRHSMISYYLFVAELSREKIAKIMHISVKIIDHYAHLDEKRTLKNVWPSNKEAS
ncbi:site-specific integrase [Bdellovibrio sp. BCCA]|uniref:site-specific integrase n=1 Tax=Bdellovibrio sp. BCCA TaxID=3136281 RepID=UPI0030F2D3B5